MVAAGFSNTRMPLGIKDSTFVFSRCLAQVLRAHRAYAVNYVDDVCITGVPPMCGHNQSYTSAIAFVADGKKDSARAKGAPVKRGSGVFGPAGLGPNAGPPLYLYNLNKRRAAELKATMDTFDAESKHGLTKVVGFVLNIRNQNGPDGMTLADGLVLATTVATFLNVLMEGGALSQYAVANATELDRSSVFGSLRPLLPRIGTGTPPSSGSSHTRRSAPPQQWYQRWCQSTPSGQSASSRLACCTSTTRL